MPRLQATRIDRIPMSTIRQDDLIDSVADALQFISYYHPADYIANSVPRLREGAVARPPATPWRRS